MFLNRVQGSCTERGCYSNVSFDFGLVSGLHFNSTTRTFIYSQFSLHYPPLVLLTSSSSALTGSSQGLTGQREIKMLETLEAFIFRLRLAHSHIHTLMFPMSRISWGSPPTNQTPSLFPSLPHWLQLYRPPFRNIQTGFCTDCEPKKAPTQKNWLKN